METNQSIMISSQIVSESGELMLGSLPSDLGLSQLLNSDEKCVVLSDGNVIQLTGTDDDIIAVTQDFNFRSRHSIINAYASGVNLLRLQNYLINHCSYSRKQFWEKATALTGFSKGALEKRIKMAESYTQEQMQLLVQAGATQSTAIFLLKGSEEKREEVFNEAREGIEISQSVVREILGDEVEDDDEDHESEDKEEDSKPLTKSKKGSSSGGGGGGSAPSKTSKSVEEKSIEQPATDVVIDVAGSFTNYSNLVTDVKDFVPKHAPLEQRFNDLIKEMEIARTKHELSTVRGLAIRGVMTNMLAAVYGISKPPEIESENEPEWVTALRDKLPKSVNRQFKPIYLMAFVDGHLGAINGEKDAPIAYEGLIKGKTLKRDGVDALYELWSEGFAQAKLVKEKAQSADS